MYVISGGNEAFVLDDGYPTSDGAGEDSKPIALSVIDFSDK